MKQKELTQDIYLFQIVKKNVGLHGLHGLDKSVSALYGSRMDVRV